MSDCALRVKALVHEKVGIAPDFQRLVYAGKQLEDERPLSHYGIQHGSTIIQMGRLKGGSSVNNRSQGMTNNFGNPSVQF